MTIGEYIALGLALAFSALVIGMTWGARDRTKREGRGWWRR